ncbi:glycosyltransferase involved in cell wall biosynthesis [Zymomonas mobilis]|uniref:Glycosyltransferase involved in cell wall biosynthesis n=1 Tax=Zymomonas mobilis TaxID=542 RepID=A0A542W1Z2_ZYMMB|nr:glycosyltransferase [Zymomonas mobilis]TQL17602.1 glycosyltransferase involved in cell wall biosynthesis [Zymomonas mobilis]
MAFNINLGTIFSKQVKFLIRSADRYRDEKKWEQASSLYKKALKINKNLPDIWIQYGHALKESGFIKKAVEAYEYAESLNQTYDVYLQLGHGLKLLGLNERAAISYARAKEISPENSEAKAEFRQLGYENIAKVAISDTKKDSFFRKNIYNEEYYSFFGPKIKENLEKYDYENIEDLLFKNHLSSEFLSYFDSKFYFYLNNMGEVYQDDLRYLCILHFIINGIDNISPLNSEMEFDPSFYEQNYDYKYNINASDLYRYWLNYGIKNNHAPNATAGLIYDNNIYCKEFLSKFDYNFYKEARGSVLPKDNKFQIINDFLGGGFLNCESIISPDYYNSRIFKATAHRATLKGDNNLGIKIFEYILSWLPDDSESLQGLGDCYFKEKKYLNAIWCYLKVIELKKDNRWTFKNLVECYMQMRCYEKSYETITEAVQRYSQYPMMENTRYSIMEKFFHQSVKNYELLAKVGKITEGQKEISKYCQLVTKPFYESYKNNKKIKSIALYGLLELKQCKFYRIDQKIEQLKKAGFKVTLFNPDADLEKFSASTDHFEAVIFYRLAPLPSVILAIEAAKRAGLTTFYEIDDLLFLPEEYPGPFDGYAGQINRETYNMLAMGVPLFAHAMSMCDYGIASTPSLARQMEPFVKKGKVYVHRNGMGSDHERYLQYQQDTNEKPYITIFYGSGTLAHKKDYLELLEPALIYIAEKYPDKVKFVLMGWLPITDALKKAAGENLTVIEPVWDVHEYWSILRESDINIAVLKSSLNVDCKSEIKWMEAAMFGIPSVLSRTATYEEVINHGINGFLCDTVNDWKNTLDSLVKDKALRHYIGKNAQLDVRKNYTIKKMGNNLKNIFNDIPIPANDVSAKKKILIVNVYYAPQTIGGATRVVYDNVNYILGNYKDEFDIQVFTCVDEDNKDYKIKIYCQDGILVKGVSRSVAGEKMTPYEDKVIGNIFREHVKRFKPDLIHFHCIQRLSLSVVNETIKAKIPYIITAHDGWWISDNQFIIDEFGNEVLYNFSDPIGTLNRLGRESFSRMQALRPALFAARKLLPVSKKFGDLYRQCGIPNVEDVENGVSNIISLEKIPSSDGLVRIAHIGGMVKHKGFDLLKRAVSTHTYKNIRIVVVDHSKSSEYSHEEIWGTTPVSVIGKVEQKDIAKLYQNIDIVIAPSIWPESFGLVTREALINKCWVIASDRGAISDNITNGENGYIIDVNDSVSLSEILREVDCNHLKYISHPKEIKQIKKSDEQSEELISIYRNIINN